MIRPIVGLAVWKRELPTALAEKETLHAIADYYVAAFRRAGAVPVLFPTLDAADVPSLLDLVDGLALTGGGDVSPETYESADRGLSNGVHEMTDAFELALVRHAESRDMPVLGICRGCQVLNVAFGGSLHQEITGTGDVHPTLEGLSREELVDARHPVALVEGSTLAGIYGVSERPVNTIHHQAIDRVADGFTPAAIAPDGVIEAIEATGAWLALGVQWHPERLPAAEEAPLFRSFVDAVRSRVIEPGGVRFA